MTGAVLVGSRMGRCAAAGQLLLALSASFATAELVVGGGKHDAKFPGLSLDSLPMNGFATLFDSEQESASAAASPDGHGRLPMLSLVKAASKLKNTSVGSAAFVARPRDALAPGQQPAAAAVSSHAKKTGASGRRPKALDFLEETSAIMEKKAARADSTIVVNDVADSLDSQLGAKRLEPEHMAFFQQQPHPLATTSWFSIIRFTISFTLIIKCIAVLSNVAMHLSPFPLVKEIKSAGATGDKDSAPFVSIAYCSSQSAFYGLYAYWVTSRSGFLVLCYSNVVGITMGMYYVVTFVGYCKDANIMALTQKYLKAAAFLISIQAIAILTLPETRSLFFVGLTSSMCSVISAFSLITTVPEVLRTKCSKSLPVPVLVCGAASAFLWFLCGVDLWDPYIAAPNGLYVLISGAALALAMYFPKEDPFEMDDVDAYKKKAGMCSDPSAFGGKSLQGCNYGSTGGSWDG